MVHDLKILPQYFQSVSSGEKTFEIRFNDRQFSVGDTLILKEYFNNDYTGRTIDLRVTYLLSSKDFPEGLKDGYVILGTTKT